MTQKDRAETYPDALLTMPTSQENIAAGLEVDAYQTGISAYIWGYPLVRMERVAREYTDVPHPKPPTSYRAPLNQIGWATALATPEAKDMPTANNDTLYMSAVVSLDEPYILHVPDTQDRYYVVNVFNMWQELEHYIGSRVTGTGAGSFALVPLGWQGALPEGLKSLQVTTDKVWLWGRLRVIQGEKLEPLLALQKQFTLRPLSQMHNTSYQPKPAPLPPLPSLAGKELGFYHHLAAALQYNRVPARDTGLFGQFARIGLTDQGFDEAKLTPPPRRGLLRALEDGPKVAVSAMVTAAINRNGWIWATGLDSFGMNYPLRALIAGPYLGAQGEKEAIYPIRSTDADGEQLTGAKNYIIRFKQEPPVNAFWSLTVYNAEDKMLVENPIQRYKLGSDTPGLKKRGDGSFDVPLQVEKPDGEFAANWLPTPRGPFYVLLRLYIPREELLTDQYALPQIEVGK
jgi:hypothetical protein